MAGQSAVQYRERQTSDPDLHISTRNSLDLNKPDGRGFETRWCDILKVSNPSGRTRPWGLLSLVTTIQELLEFHGSGLENREYGRWDLSSWLRGTLSAKFGTNFADKRRSLGWYSSLADSRHGDFRACFLIEKRWFWEDISSGACRSTWRSSFQAYELSSLLGLL
jgi:hypothetical protein